MSLAFIPLFIKYLGIEAYGLIGLFGVLQVWLGLLDMGMTPMLNREMARFTGGSYSAIAIRDLLRSIELIALCVAAFICLGIWAASGWLASDWLRAEKLPIDSVAKAFAIMGAVASFRFVEGIYRSCILGLQKQVLFNVVNSAQSTLRGLGSLCLLMWLSPTIEVFFIWQGIVSMFSLISLACITYRTLPRAERGGRFSFQALRGVGRFAGGMMGGNLLAMLLTQIDKIMLSKMLSLSELGYFTFASSIAGILFMLIGPVTTAFYPRLCELYSRREHVKFAATFHQAAQLVTILAGSMAIVVVLFAETLLFIWTRDAELANRSYLLVSLLMIGNLLNGLCFIPAQAMLAHGITVVGIKVNTVAVFLIVPSILIVVPVWGAVGSASIWVALNVGYVLVGLQFTFNRILQAEKWRWYLRDIVVPLASGLIATCAVKLVFPKPNGILEQIAVLLFASIIAFSTAVFACDQTRLLLKNVFKYDSSRKSSNL